VLETRGYELFLYLLAHTHPSAIAVLKWLVTKLASAHRRLT
jgi:hypothetical protein